MSVKDLRILVEVGESTVFAPVSQKKQVRAIDFAQTCPQCQHRMQHGGCPLEVFNFDQGRYMCDAYLDSFSG